MATAALFLWLIVPICLFVALGPVRGLIWSALIGYLFLPEAFGFNLPGLPPYNKASALTLSLLLPGVIYWRRVPRASTDGSRLAMLLLGLCMLVYLLSGFGTVATNPSPIVIADSFRTGLSFHDAISMASGAVFLLLPAVFAWRFLRGPEAHRALLEAIVAVGLFYSLLVLFEWRMSPQLHNWVYGYFPHSWLQHVRGDGFRPVVFLRHGLWVGLFLYMATIAAAAMAWQATGQMRALYGAACGWLLLILFMSYNLGATMMALMFLPVVLILSRRLQLWVVTAVAVVVLAYPALRDVATGPLNIFVAQIEQFAPERAGSFQVRLDNETALLDRANEKPVFGWGGWSRARVFDERGRDISITDGLWIIVKGQQGWVGYLTFFGLITVPLFFLARTRRQGRLEPATMGIAIILAGNLIYTIPNSALSPISWIMIGALAGFVTRGVALELEARATVDDLPTEQSSGPRLTRFPDGLAPASASDLRETSSPSVSRYRRDTPLKDA